MLDGNVANQRDNNEKENCYEAKAAVYHGRRLGLDYHSSIAQYKVYGTRSAVSSLFTCKKRALLVAILLTLLKVVIIPSWSRQSDCTYGI